MHEGISVYDIPQAAEGVHVTAIFYPDTQRVFVAGTPVKLTQLQAKMLQLLSSHAGFVVTQKMFMDHLYFPSQKRDPKIIDVTICRLRSILEANGFARDFLASEWGRGHRLGSKARPPKTQRSGLPASAYIRLSGRMVESTKRAMYELLYKDACSAHEICAWFGDMDEAELVEWGMYP